MCVCRMYFVCVCVCVCVSFLSTLAEESVDTAPQVSRGSLQFYGSIGEIEGRDPDAGKKFETFIRLKESGGGSRARK